MTAIRPAVPAEYVTVRSILEAALLEVEDGKIRRSSVLVAEEDGRILGALVLDGSKIEAIAVRPGRRGQGIGSELIATAGERRPTLSAEFEPDVREFYASLEFDIDTDGGRCYGVLRTTSGRGLPAKPHPNGRIENSDSS